MSEERATVRKAEGRAETNRTNSFTAVAAHMTRTSVGHAAVQTKEHNRDNVGIADLTPLGLHTPLHHYTILHLLDYTIYMVTPYTRLHHIHDYAIYTVTPYTRLQHHDYTIYTVTRLHHITGYNITITPYLSLIHI